MGPDGFPNFFFNKGVVLEEILISIWKGCLLKEFNTTLIALLPKSLGANRWKDFRPLLKACVRLSTSFSQKSTIGLSRSSQSWPNQEAIVKGRHIGEGLIIANETIHSMDRIQESDCLKLDMMKAYDRLEWPFLLSMSGLSPSSTERPRE